MEGFLWKFIRGAGLAYGANIVQDIESGIIYYRVSSGQGFAQYGELTLVVARCTNRPTVTLHS